MINNKNNYFIVTLGATKQPVSEFAKHSIMQHFTRLDFISHLESVFFESNSIDYSMLGEHSLEMQLISPQVYTKFLDFNGFLQFENFLIHCQYQLYDFVAGIDRILYVSVKDLTAFLNYLKAVDLKENMRSLLIRAHDYCFKNQMSLVINIETTYEENFASALEDLSTNDYNKTIGAELIHWSNFLEDD